MKPFETFFLQIQATVEYFHQTEDQMNKILEPGAPIVVINRHTWCSHCASRKTVLKPHPPTMGVPSRNSTVSVRSGSHVHVSLCCCRCYCFFSLLCMVLDAGSIE